MRLLDQLDQQPIPVLADLFIHSNDGSHIGSDNHGVAGGSTSDEELARLTCVTRYNPNDRRHLAPSPGRCDWRESALIITIVGPSRVLSHKLPIALIAEISSIYDIGVK